MATRELNDLRNKIDDLDKVIIECLEKRFDIANDIKKIKKQKCIAVYDSKREEEIFKKIKKSVKNNEYLEYINACYNKIFEMSKNLQNEEK